VGPSQRPAEGVGVQGARPGCLLPRPRRRLCLLKGCEQPFEPSHPQARYCSTRCRAGARRWRCWRASRTYRAGEQGQARRREQSRRYRTRRQQRERAAAEPHGEPDPPAPESAEPREGQRPALESEESCCARPGCYAGFVRGCRSLRQNFCDWLCRQALRRVRQREARWRRRLGEAVHAAAARATSIRGSPLR
jgi:hypothetical protein